MNQSQPELGSVLYVTRKWPPAVGGMETYSVNLTAALAHSLRVETYALPGRSNGLPPTAWDMVRFSVEVLWRYVRRSGPPSVLHVGDMAAWPLALLSWVKGPAPAIILSAHGTDVAFHRRKGWKGRLYGRYLRLGSKLIPRGNVIANSAATADAAAETGWSGATVVPLATDFLRIDPPASHDRHLLFAGRLVERKGCLWFVENVLPLLPEDIGLKVAGPVWDKAEADVLDHPRVTYLGSLNKEDLIVAYRSSLCVIVPNIETESGEFEGFGLVATEASAVGGLVLASATGGLVEAVKDGGTGLLLKPGDAEVWRDKIVEIDNWSDAARDVFLRQAMRMTKEFYSWKRVASDVLSIYRSALADREAAVVRK